MLSAATLERVSIAYKRGYMDGYNGRPNIGAGVDDQYLKPFAEGDYADGFGAGKNDRKWVGMVRCPMCHGADTHCTLCDGNLMVTGSQANEFHRQNPGAL